MSYNDNIVVELNHVWKKYNRQNVFHKSLREDIVNLFKPRETDNSLSENEFWALKDINMSLRRGESIGIYGPNGAGKSTILKLIARVTYPTRGEIKIAGRVAPLIEIGAGFHLDLSGRENILVNGAILGMTIPEIKKKMEAIIKFSELEEFIDMPVKKYSSGMYLRLAFSIAIHSDADIFLIDEILAVGDQEFREKCIRKIEDLRRTDKSLIIVSHNKEQMKRLTDKIVILDKGKIIKVKESNAL